MSVNQLRQKILYRQKDSTNQNRGLLVFECSNEASHYNTNVKDKNDNTITMRYYPHTFTRFEVYHQYLNTPFKHANVVITNRFTMDSVKEKLTFTENTVVKKIIDTKDASSIVAQVISADKENYISLTLSMSDFMYGDVYIQFYDNDDESDKDTYDAPIIFQFTNAPTVFTGSIYKWRPGADESTSAIADKDNVFSSAFGSKYSNVADKGRTDVLKDNTSTTANYYNDFLLHDRLITNGYVDPDNSLVPARSLSGHPTYAIEYVTIVPSAFSRIYGVEQRPVEFVPYRNESSAYLTSSVDNLETMYEGEKQSLPMIIENDYLPYTAITTYSASNESQAVSANCSIKTFTVQLTANSATRPDDRWFRNHTRVCADFVLKGVDLYWLANTEEFMTDYSYRHYRIIDNYADYATPIAERKWVYHSWGTRYYTLNKGCYEDRYNPENWTKIYEYSSNRDMSSVIIPTDQFEHGIEVDNDGAPILILEHTGNVACIDSELVQRMVHNRYDESIGKTCRFALSCDDVKDDPYMFKVMSLITTYDRRAVIYRISDMAYPTRTFDDGYNGDGEWAIMIARNA